MNFLYPSDPLNPKKSDEMYAEEYSLAKSSGHQCYLFNTDDIDAGSFCSFPKLNEENALIYRGWMLTPEQYKKLEQLIINSDASLITTSEQYKHCHYLPEWYQDFQELTPKTVFAKKDSDFDLLVKQLGWKQYFIKDYVKSLTISRGSIAKDALEIREIILLLEKYRGNIDGGICLREFENLDTDSEERYFVYKDKIYSRNDKIPKIVNQITTKIKSPFYSIDIVNNTNGEARLMELGDGQVSDIKKWNVNKFMNIFSS